MSGTGTWMRPPRIVHLHKFVGVSGSENHLAQLLPGLARRGFETTLLMLTGGGWRDGAYARRLADAGVRMQDLPIRADVDPALILSLVRWFRRERPDIVHTHLIHADFHGLIAARLAHVPVVISTKHNDDPFRRRALVALLERWLSTRTARVIAISDWIRDFSIRVSGIDPARIVRIHYGFTPEPVECKDRAELMQTLGFGREDRLILSVGRLVEQKGHAELVDAFATIAEAYPAVRLLIAGEGPLRPVLESRIERFRLSGRVVLAGQRADVGALMSACYCVVHPSRWEGFGLVLLEAMSAAKPIVATAVSAIPEIVVDGVTGLVVPPSQPEALAAAMAALLTEERTARRMGEQGWQRWRERFSVDRMVDETSSLYSQVLPVDCRRTGQKEQQ